MLDKSELKRIRPFTEKAEIDKAFHTLEGILKGIYIDKVINKTEIDELSAWCANYISYIDRQQFSEVIPLIEKALEDGKLTEDEIEDLKWFIGNLITKNKYYDVVTSDIQRLEGIIHGILADNEINNAEIECLKQWLLENEHLIGVYPFDEIEATLVGITEDGIVTDEERDYLKVFLSQFIDYKESYTIDKEEIAELKKTIHVAGVCSLNAVIEFDGRIFCFTGTSKKVKRSELCKIIENNGGRYKDTVLNDTDYLIVGSEGNPCWAFSCYGRKVEKAMQQRKIGSKICIVNEIDFWDALVE